VLTYRVGGMASVKNSIMEREVAMVEQETIAIAKTM
jgi:hypothetical protein